MADQKCPPIDEEKFMAWLESRQKEIGAHVVKGQKILVNSPWQEDRKLHCALFTGRGERGRFHDFKSGKAGNLFDFVMEIDGCSFGQAIAKVGAGEGTKRRKKRIAETPAKSIESLKCSLQWPKGLTLIEAGHTDPDVQAAAEYLASRSIDPTLYDLYFCTRDHRTGHEGKKFDQRLKGRILVPYFAPDGNPIYWSARAISKRVEPRYYEPHPSDGPADKEAVLFCPFWRKVEGKAVLVCEGAFDCLSLWTAGISAVATGGAALYDLQRIVMAQLGMQPIWAFDRDKAGRKATLDAAKLYGKPSAFIFAPNDASGSEKGHDWNSFLITEGSAMVRQYVMDNIAPLDEKFTFALMRSLTA